MMKGKVIIIDGISNAGKTTLCDFLSKEHNIIIEEVPEFIKRNKEKYGVDKLAEIPNNLEEEKFNQNLLLSAEIDRLITALDVINKGYNAILDRSFLSTVAIAYSFNNLNSFNGAYDYARELLKNYFVKINSLFKRDELIFIFLEVNKEKINERNLQRKKPLAEQWINESILEPQRRFFKVLSEEFQTEIINTTDLATEQIRDIIKNKIGSGIKL